MVGVKLSSTDRNNVNSIAVEHAPNNKIKDELFAVLTAINAPMLSVKEVVLTLDDVFYSLTDRDKKRIDAERAEEQERQAAKKNRKFGKRAEGDTSK